MDEQRLVMKASEDALEFFRARLARMGLRHDGAFLYAVAFVNERGGCMARSAVMTDADVDWVAEQFGQGIVDDVSETLIRMAGADRMTHAGVEAKQ